MRSLATFLLIIFAALTTDIPTELATTDIPLAEAPPVFTSDTIDHFVATHDFSNRSEPLTCFIDETIRTPIADIHEAANILISRTVP